MRLHFVSIKDGKKRICWPFLGSFVVGVYALVLGAAEALWLSLAGGPSLLVGLYALVLATLIVIRVVGASLVKPADLIRAETGAV